ncbi:helix-turn-helix domain-containing protein [Ascidiimonas sp. W6]|uniref:helix-turn-helix domain-containing protein n=1 Tax=Ascidiimonas meishanensis TaxID=3128903 RepID=UPI0030EF0C69
MENRYTKFIHCDDIEIATSCEDSIGAVLNTYLPSTILLFTQVGQLNIKIDQELFSIPRGHFGLLRKYTTVEIFKTWKRDEGYAKTYGFMLTNNYIRKVIDGIVLPKDLAPTTKRFMKVPKTKELNELMVPLIAHIDNGKDLDTNYIENKTLEALIALVKAKKELSVVFKEFSLAERADIEELMFHNYLYNIPLKTLAEQSGRSLSTFNRDFRSIFNETPHKWILNKRLEYARNIMFSKKKRPSEVFLQAGFENLAHFSRSFKKKYAITPSDYFKTLN